VEVRRLPGDDPLAVEALAGGPGAVLVAEERGERLGVAGVRPRDDVAELGLEWRRDERAADALAAAARDWARIRGLTQLDGEPLDPPDRVIATGRLLIRPLTPDDLAARHAIRGREDVVRYLYQQPSTLDEERERLAQHIAGVRFAVTGDALSFAIEHDGTMVGDCVLMLPSAEHHQGEIGFTVHPDHQGRGYATEAARALLELGFAGFGLHRIAGRVEARNTPSATVLERVGMRREAHLVENELVKGEWQSELVYAILAREWSQSQPRRRK
jgi:RimJ/RimL family protein N-acetyltransferase